MPMAGGSRIGPYEILSPLGAGGMGEVYRARDSKLGREVALKVLPAALANDADYLARFQREAQVLASLNHPNIAQIYGLEGNAIVMELVEGQHLPASLPLEQALDVARQIAEALEAAHDKGIIHRDLKPANIKITPDGVVKVLDFGLAKATESAAAAANAANSPTLTIHSTQAGLILGTAAYMSPEQASGRPVDKRADIWAFGVVLYEMLSSTRLFDAETISHTLADVLRRDIDFSKLPSDTPPRIRTLLERCLDRNLKTRLRDIGEARIVIQATDTAPAPAQTPSNIPWAIAGAAALLAILAFAFALARRAEPATPFRLTLLPPENSLRMLNPEYSPDGRRIVFTAADSSGSKLWIRDMDSWSVKPIEGTEGGQYPFWSPDGRNIGFFAKSKLVVMELASGNTTTLAAASAGRGGTWNKNGVILFAPALRSGIHKVAASGGTAEEITHINEPLDGLPTHRYPRFLPDGTHFLFTVRSADAQKTGIYVGDISTNQSKRILPARSQAVPTDSGYIFFYREGNLVAQKLDLSRLEMTGDPITVAERLLYQIINMRADFTAASNGWIAFAPDIPAPSAQMNWVDRQGRSLGSAGPAARALRNPRISPDGKSIAYERWMQENGTDGIWIYDLVRNTTVPVYISAVQINNPVWSPDSREIVFNTLQPTGLQTIRRKSLADSEIRSLVDGGVSRQPDDWSHDGQFLIFSEIDPNSASNIMGLELKSGGTAQQPFPLVHTPAREASGRLSPDGKWIAYVSNESGSDEIYLLPFRSTTGRKQVSINGGTRPVWSRNGNELFYVSTDDKLMSVVVRDGGASTPTPLFDAGSAKTEGYDVAPDGRFLIVRTLDAHRQVPLNIIGNWRP